MESGRCWSLPLHVICGAFVVLFLEGCGGDATTTAAQKDTTTPGGDTTTTKATPSGACINKVIDLHTQSNDGKVTGTYDIQGVTTPMPLPPIDATITEKVDFEKMNYFVDLKQTISIMGQTADVELMIVFNAEEKRITAWYNMSGMTGCNYTIQEEMPAPDAMSKLAKQGVQAEFNCSGSDGTYDTFVMDAGEEGNKTHIEVQMDKDYLIHSATISGVAGGNGMSVKLDLDMEMDKSTTDGPSAADLDVSRFEPCHNSNPTPPPLATVNLYDFFQPGLGSVIHPQLRFPGKTLFQRTIVMAMRNSLSAAVTVV